MPYYHIKDFVRGLDTRRMVETTEPGSLIVAKNCVITRGGEIEKRKAWNPIKSLPDNTFGLYALGGTGGDFHVWGTLENPGVMPGGVTYHRLQHPDGEEIKFIRCVRYFRKKFFVIAQFENDDILAYYDGVPIIEDPRPPEDADPASPPVAVEQNPVGGNRATIMLSPVRNQQNTACSIIKVSAWRLTGDALAGSDSWEAHDIYSGSIAIPADADAHQLNQLVADAINTYVPSGPNFNAKAGTDGKLFISFADDGEQYNGWRIAITQNPITPAVWTFRSAGSQETFGGGTDAANSVDPTPDPPDPDPAPDPDPDAPPTVDAYFLPGQFALQHASKMFAVTGRQGLLRASALNAPDLWAIDAAGAGYIDYSQHGGRKSPNLTSLGVFQGNLAIFADKTIYLWYMDPDLAQSQEVSVIENTGTLAPRSVVEYGNTDVFYLDRSGIRSLQSRELTGAAFASDIGNPIDDLVREKFQALSYYAAWADSTIDPVDGRYVLALGDTMYVFTYYAKTKISAWTEWNVGFFIEDLVSDSARMYCRSRDTIYCYGAFPSAGAHDDYDDCEVEVQTPYLDAGDPATMKTLIGMDVALQGEWLVSLGVDYTNIALIETVGTIDATTFRQARVPMQGYATHASLHLRHAADGYARIGNLIWHYQKGEQSG
jgi:hypothetical protein